MSGPALAVTDLEVRYGPVAAVRGVSFEVGPGEIVGLIGPNGAGKSSTLHAIMGLVRIGGGDVRLGERSLRGKPPEAVARSGIALVPEGRRIFGELTVDENLRLGLAGRRTADGADEDVMRSVLTEVLVPAISVGSQQPTTEEREVAGHRLTVVADQGVEEELRAQSTYNFVVSGDTVWMVNLASANDEVLAEAVEAVTASS